MHDFEAQVGFASCAGPVPDPGLFETAEEFRDHAATQPRDWVYHLAVRPAVGPAHSSLLYGVPAAELDALAASLRRDHLLDGIGFVLEARECLRGADTPACQGGCKGCAVLQEVSWEGQSHQLALAVGLVAAQEHRSIPPWVMFSANVLPGTTHLGPTDRLAHKVRIALGHGAGFEHIAPLVTRMYDRPGTEHCLGRLEERVLPGRVKLLVIGPLEGPPRLEGLAVEEVAISLERCRACAPAGREQYLRGLAGDGLLLAPVAEVASALDLVGFQKTDEPQAPWIKAYRVLPRRGTRDAEYWEERRDYLEALRREVRRRQPADHRAAVETILRLCRRELDRHLPDGVHCFAGHVAIVQSRDPGWLRIVARQGPAADMVLATYPCTVGITRRTLAERRRQAVGRTAADVDFQQAASPNSPARDGYQDEAFTNHQALLSRVRACVKLPILNDAEAVGVLTLYCDAEVNGFDDGLLDVLEGLAGQLVQPLQLLEAQPDPVADPLEGLRDDYGELMQQIFSGYLSTKPEALKEARTKLSNDLADAALKRARAFRTAVRILNPAGTHLLVTGCAGGKDVYPDWFQNEEHPRAEDSAANYALDECVNVYYEDTTRKGIRFRPIAGPRQARAHASVLLRSGGHVLGVLSVDWDEAREVPPTLRQRLEQLACRYAIALKAVTVDAAFGDLDRHLGRTDAFLRAAGQLVGARCLAMYLRNAATGLYELQPGTSVGHSESWKSDDARGYARGQGMIGWVAQQKQSLRIANWKDEAELAQFTPRPQRLTGQSFERELGDGPVAWMGVPIAQGGEVFGVLRFANRNPSLKEGFSVYEQKIAEAAAARLAGHLARQRETARRTALLDYGARLFGLARPRDLGPLLFGVLEDRIGPCSVSVRLLDRAGLADRTLVPAVRRLLTNEPLWRERTPHLRVLDRGISSWVCRTGQRFVSWEMPLENLADIVIDEGTRQALGPFGGHVCVPLRNAAGEVSGALHVARKSGHSLSESDVDFISDLAQLMGAALEQVTAARQERLEVALRRARDQAGCCARIDRDPVLAGKVLEALIEVADAAGGLVWLPDAQGKTFRAYSPGGESVGSMTLPAAAVRESVCDLCPALVSEPERDSILSPLVAPLATATGHRAAITIAGSGGPLAVFALVGPAGEALSFQALDEAQCRLCELDWSQGA